MAIIGAYGYTTGILLCPQCHDHAPTWAGERSSSRPILAETLRAFYEGAKAPCCDNCGASLTGTSHESITAAILAAEEFDYE
jgi:hypothetical protein